MLRTNADGLRPASDRHVETGEVGVVETRSRVVGGLTVLDGLHDLGIGHGTLRFSWLFDRCVTATAGRYRA